MLNFKEVYVKNFNSIEELRFSFQSGKHLVTGPNGVGKSSIFEAILWTFYKRNLRDKDPTRDYKGNCVTGVKFEKNGVQYEIIRYTRDKTKGSALELYIDGELSSHRKTTSTEAEVQNLLSIQPDICLSTILVLQGLPVNFSAMTPTVRKLILEDMRGFQQWDEFKDLFSARHKQVNLEKTTVEAAAQDVNNSVNRLQSKVETLQQVASLNISELDSQIQATKESARAVDSTYQRLSKEYLAALGGFAYEVLSKQVQSMQQTKFVVTQRLVSLAKTIQDKICSQCHQPYPLEKIEAAEAEVAAMTDKIKNLDNLIAEESVTIESATRLNNSLVSTGQQLTQLQYTLERLAEQRFKPLETAEPYEKELETLYSKQQECLSTVEAVKGSSEHLRFIHDTLLPSSQFRASVLERHLGFINSALFSVTPLIFDDLAIKLLLDSKKQGIEIEVIRKGKEIQYKSLSGGERRRVDITLVLAFQRFLMQSSGVTSNLLVFDEIFDGLDKNGIERVLMSIDSLFPESSSVYVVTHNNSIKSSFSSVVRVTKEGDVTKVSDYEESFE